MDKVNLKNSIALIGPKAVGKSLTAEHLAEKTGYAIFSSDNLENFCMLFIEGNFRSFSEIKSVVKSEFTDEKYLKKHPNASEEALAQNRKSIANYLKEIEFYGTNPNFQKIKQMMYRTINILRSNKYLSTKQQLFIMQYQKIKMIQEALDGINMPLIADFGADIGSVISLIDVEKHVIAEIFKTPFKTLENNQKKFFEQFGSVVYLEPGIDYQEKGDPRSKDQHNSIYSENKKSYISFANIVTSMNGLFVDPRNYIFANDSYFDADVLLKKQQLLDKANVQNICEQIQELVEGLKHMQ